MHTVVRPGSHAEPTTAPDRPSAPARVGDRRRDRLHRPGAAAAAVAPSGGRAGRGDVVGRDGVEKAARARPPVDGRDHAALARRRSRDADVVFLALPDAAAAELAPALVDAGVRVIDLSGAFRLTAPAERARWYPETHRVPEGIVYGLTELAGGAVAGARLVANPGCYPTATLLALAPLAARRPPGSGQRHHRRREIGRVGRRQDAVRANAFLRGPRQPGGVRRVRPPPRRRNRAGHRRRDPRSAPDHFRAASRAARSRHPVDDLRAPGARHDRRRRWRRSTSRPTRRRRSSGSSDRRCRKSSTSRTRTSATSAGASMRRAVPSSCRSSTTCSRAHRARRCRTST